MRTMEVDRYHRQSLLPQIGREGQDRLSRASVLLVGCGALGCVIAEQLVRAGLGFLRVADRDIVELTNLQRQVLFDEEDAKLGTPKAVAAGRRLARVNSQVVVEPRVVDVHGGNVEALAGLGARDDRVDLILDGTDNVETRYLINDVSVKHGVPWVYGACVGTGGRVLAVRPPGTACLRCLFAEPPGAGELPTCDTAGVLGAAAAVVASLQVTAAIQILVGAVVPQQMVTLDVWGGRFKAIDTTDAKRADCVACGLRRFEFLDNQAGSRSTSLCGRNAVQVRPARDGAMDLDAVAARLRAVGEVERTPWLVRCAVEEMGGVRLTVFPDGRVIVQGVADAERARSICARFVGG